jgi:hypothetical protein
MFTKQYNLTYREGVYYYMLLLFLVKQSWIRFGHADMWFNL